MKAGRTAKASPAAGVPGEPVARAAKPRPANTVEAEGPLYRQLARTLKDEILRGVHAVGAQLPTEDELGVRFGVSRYTVREALRQLRDEGLVSSRQGSGTSVAAPPAQGPDVLHATSINDLVDFASGKHFEVEAIRLLKLDAKLAARIGLKRGEEWLAVRGFRFAEGAAAPVCRTEYYINREFASVARLLQRHDGPIFPLIEDLFAVRIEEVRQEIAATIIAADMADGLQVEPGSLALEVRRTYTLGDGRVAQVTLNTHPAAKFRQSMTMRRVKG